MAEVTLDAWELAVAQRTVRSGEVELSVRTGGPEDRPTVILVHGFPDTQAMWDPVAERLARDLQVVTYDVRGAGESTTPSSRAGYETTHLIDDLVAVRDAIAPERDVHLVGHDWGSVQLWDAVTTEESDERLRGRISSFTSISGPPLDYYGHFVRQAIKGGKGKVGFRQLAHSWYIAAFQIPGAAEWVFRNQTARLRSTLTKSQRLEDDRHWAPTLADDGANGVNLYRANGVGRLRQQRPIHTSVPVQLIVPEYDDFLVPAMYDDLPAYIDDLSRFDIKAGHWVARTHPGIVAERIRSFVLDHVGGRTGVEP